MRKLRYLRNIFVINGFYSMFKGTALVLGACFIWGLIFVIPGLMTGYTSLEVALGRYFFLGIISCLFMLGQGWKKWKQFPWPIWRQAIIFALMVNILYYFSLVTGLRYSNPSVIALLLGLSPITIAFYGNWREQECSYRVLILPSLFIFAGLICVNWSAFSSISLQATWEYAFGLVCGIFSLIAWNWYVIANNQFLKRNEQVSSSDWSTMIGFTTFGWVIGIIPFVFLSSPSQFLLKFTQFEQPLFTFLLGCMVLGFFCSWLGSYLWNLGSQAMPISLAGQLTIFETIFGLIFVYLLEGSFPSATEFVGMMAILIGVAQSLHLLSKPIASASKPITH